MNAAEIDIPKNKSMVAVLQPFGEIVMLTFEVKHSIAEPSELAEQLKAIDGETRVVIKHTEWYYESVTNVLHEA